MTWFLSELEVAARAAPRSELLWSIPTAKSDRAFNRAFNWGESAIAPDAVGKMIVDGLHIPFYFEYELRARHPKGVLARLGVEGAVRRRAAGDAGPRPEGAEARKGWQQVPAERVAGVRRVRQALLRPQGAKSGQLPTTSAAPCSRRAQERAAPAT